LSPWYIIKIGPITIPTVARIGYNWLRHIGLLFN